MQPPLIGLTTYNQKNKAGYPISALMHRYIEAVVAAGGTPVLIPTGLGARILRALFDRLDGILFTGGGDVEPRYYGGDAHPEVGGVDQQRDETELELVRLAVQTGKPFLGICRGLQIINVAQGGALYTHVPDQHPGALKHNRDSATEREYLAHGVEVVGESRLASAAGALHFEVNSLHHQGISRLGTGLRPVAYAPDALIEGIELTDHPFGLAVQWHPEWLLNYEHARGLFAAFVHAAARKAG